MYLSRVVCRPTAVLPALKHTAATAAATRAMSSAATAATAQQQQQPRHTRWHRRLAWIGLGTATAGAALYSTSSDAVASSPASLSSASCSATAAPAPSLLSHSKVYALLSSPAESIRPIGRGRVKELHSNQYAANAVIEDTFAVLPSVAAPGGGLLLGVFDGHSGKDASNWCAEELLQYLQYYRWSNRTDALVHPRAFHDADHHFLELSLRDKQEKRGMSGACVNVSHIAGNTVRTANAGDCRTIVGRRIKKSGSGDAASSSYQYQAVELTHDHQIDTNYMERDRLLRDHPDEHDVISRNRVKGRLQPTRGFGDGYYKRREFYAHKKLPRPYAQWTPPYTTVDPDITQYDLHADDDFMIMASDGLFQDLHSQQVVEHVGQWMQMHEAEIKRQQNAGRIASAFGSTAGLNPLYTANASTYLIKQALIHASEHSLGRRRIENENISWIMQLPVENKRDRHDDVTVLVVFFDHSSRLPADTPLQLPAGPPVPPTLRRALDLHLKTPSAPALQIASAARAGPVTIPIRIAPITSQNQNQTASTPESQSHTTIRSNL